MYKEIFDIINYTIYSYSNLNNYNSLTSIFRLHDSILRLISFYVTLCILDIEITIAF